MDNFKYSLMTIPRIILLILTLMNVFIWTPIPVSYVEKDIVPYYDKYMVNYNQFCKTAPSHVIVLTDVGDGILGLCVPGLPGKKVVLISKKDWYGWMTDLDKFQVLTHELGHCYLDKPHSMNMDNYMYYSFHLMIEKQVIYQSEVDMKEYCGGINK